jgi:hypothetical protein
MLTEQHPVLLKKTSKIDTHSSKKQKKLFLENMKIMIISESIVKVDPTISLVDTAHQIMHFSGSNGVSFMSYSHSLAHIHIHSAYSSSHSKEKWPSSLNCMLWGTVELSSKDILKSPKKSALLTLSVS